MIVAVMQPYWLPYLGYFQLLHAADVFVVYDDVQYMKNGWVNRNRLLSGGNAYYFNLPIVKDTHTKLINERELQAPVQDIEARICRQVEISYGRAPQFLPTMAALKDIFSHREPNLAGFLTDQLRVLKRHLKLKAEIHVSSQLGIATSLAGEDRIIAICRHLGARTYLNAIGGTGLYHGGRFEDAGLSLRFVRSALDPYRQFGHPFVPGLSIIDAMMFNDQERLQWHLGRYELIAPEGPAPQALPTGRPRG